MADETLAPDTESERESPEGKRSTAGNAGYVAGSGARRTGEILGAGVRIVTGTIDGAKATVKDAASGATKTIQDGRTGVLSAKGDALDGFYSALGKERPLIGAGRINQLTKNFKAPNRAGLAQLEHLLKDAAKMGSENPDGKLSDAQLDTLVRAATSEAGVSRMKINVDRVAARGIVGALGGAFAGGIVGLYKDISSLSFKNLQSSAILAVLVAGAALAAGVAVAALLPFAIAGAAVGMFFKAAAGLVTGAAVGGIGYATFGGKKHDVDNALKAAFNSAAREGHSVVEYRGVAPQRTQEKATTGAGQVEQVAPAAAAPTESPPQRNFAEENAAITEAKAALASAGAGNIAEEPMLKEVRAILVALTGLSGDALKTQANALRAKTIQNHPESKELLKPLFDALAEGDEKKAYSAAHKLPGAIATQSKARLQGNQIKAATVLTTTLSGLKRYTQFKAQVSGVSDKLKSASILTKLEGVAEMLALAQGFKKEVPVSMHGAIDSVIADVKTGNYDGIKKKAESLVHETNKSLQFQREDIVPTKAAVKTPEYDHIASLGALLGEQFGAGELAAQKIAAARAAGEKIAGPAVTNSAENNR